MLYRFPDGRFTGGSYYWMDEKKAPQRRRVGGYAADAVIVCGSGFAPNDLAVNHRRVGGKAANPTRSSSGD